MKQPVEPKKEDCCDSGCNPCIFDVYAKQMQLYQLNKCGENVNSFQGENAISQLEYSPYYVIKKIDVCEQHKLILFGNMTVSEKRVLWNPGEHFLVKYSNGKKTCTRAYTPLKIEQEKEVYDFAIILKRYNNGLVSNYLYDLNVGDLTLWRGPYGQYLGSDGFSRIVMIAQGTGIAPLYSIIKHILNDEDNVSKIILLFCCKGIESILLRDELYSLKSYWNFNYEVHLSKNLEKPLKYKEPISTERLTVADLIKLKPFAKTDQFLLCGSDQFTKHFHKFLQEETIPKENIVIF